MKYKVIQTDNLGLTQEGKLYYCYSGLGKKPRVGDVLEIKDRYIRFVVGNKIEDLVGNYRNSHPCSADVEYVLVQEEKEQMKNFCVATNEDTWDLAVTAAFAAGYLFHGKEKIKFPYAPEVPYLSFCPSKKSICGNYTKPPNYELVKIANLVKVLDGNIKLSPLIKIGEHEVEFTDDGIKVGCQTVTTEQIKQIAKEKGLL
jgi:hypothetical protein